MPETIMPRATTAVADHRRRLRSRGLRRIEVQVRDEDAALIRAVAAALADPERASQTRLLLQHRFAPGPQRSLKELLASAPPLDDLILERPSDPGRPVEL